MSIPDAVKNLHVNVSTAELAESLVTLGKQYLADAERLDAEAVDVSTNLPWGGTVAREADSRSRTLRSQAKQIFYYACMITKESEKQGAPKTASVPVWLASHFNLHPQQFAAFAKKNGIDTKSLA